MGFLVLFGVGLLLTVVTFIVGELFELGGDGASDGGGGPGDASPSPFSSRILFVFLTAFGGFGFIGSSLDWSVWLSALLATVGGFGVAAGTFVLIVLPMTRSQGATTTREEDYLDREAQVTAEIPEGGLGRISLVSPVSGARVSSAARSANGQRIEFGVAVRVIAVGAGVVTVTRLIPNDLTAGSLWPQRKHS